MMTKRSLLAAAVFLCASATAAGAQQSDMAHHAAHGAMSPSDQREMLNFPPEMQVNFLANMRDHMQTLNEVLQAMAGSDYAGAARIASERLGLDSPSAAGCKPSDKPAAAPAAQSKPAASMSMDEMMALYMPEAMRAVGLSMHTSASEFAAVAAQAATTRDQGAVVTALSRVTENCVACHSAYRLR